MHIEKHVSSGSDMKSGAWNYLNGMWQVNTDRVDVERGDAGAG